MGYEIRADYTRQYLLPPSVENWVQEDHPARMIRDLVDALDLKGLGFCEPAAVMGRPPYSADLLLKVWLYGYTHKVRSTRGLERACRDHLGLIWLTGQNEPDHNTLWRFFRTNRVALRKMFKRVVQLAIRANLVGVVLHAIDGTKLAAQASREKVRSKKQLEGMLSRIDEAVEEVMREIEAAEAKGGSEYRLPPEWQETGRRREQIRELLQELEVSEREQIHELEREARMMKQRGGGIAPGYNGQIAVDAASGLIVAQTLTQDESDNHQMVNVLDEVADTVGTVAEQTLVDGGYHSPQELRKAEERGYSVLVNNAENRQPSEEAPDTDYHASRFRHDPQEDVCICPRGEKLGYEGIQLDRGGRQEIRRYHCRVYKDCPVRWLCSKSKTGRRISITRDHAAVVAQREKQRDPVLRELLRRRKEIVEAPFGTIKQRDAFRRFSLFGLESCRAQWAMVCTAFNLLKLLPYWREGKLQFA